MAVYVDDMYKHPVGRLGQMKMSHMIADTTEELLAMADKIGVNRKWLQSAGDPDEHFDIALTKRTRAVLHGAIQITMRQAARMVAHRRTTGSLGLAVQPVATKTPGGPTAVG